MTAEAYATPPTLIDTVLDAVLAILADVPLAEGRVYEDRQAALTREETPALLVQLDSADAQNLGDNDPRRAVLHIQLRLDVTVVVRGATDWRGGEASLRQLAAPLFAAAHRALIADPSLGNLPARVRWRRAQWQQDGGDGNAGLATHSYDIVIAARERDLLPPA